MTAPLLVELHEASCKLWPRLQSLLSEEIENLSLPVRLGVSKENAVVLLVPAKFISVEILNDRPKLSTLIIPHAAVEPNVKQALEAAGRESDIKVFNVHHNAAATAEYACALLFALARRVVPSDRHLRANDWTYRSRVRAGTEGAQLLYRGTALILGYGSVGSRVARVLGALGMRVLATKRGTTRKEVVIDCDPAKKRRMQDDVNIYAADQVKELLPVCSVLVVSLPLTSSTRGLLGNEELALLPRGCCIVNVGRAEIIDEDALWLALNDQERGLSFASDVWWQEPLPGDDGIKVDPSRYPFVTLDKVVLSPHHAGGIGLDGIEEERAAVLAELLAGLVKVGPLPTPVNLEVGY